jgi:hypothetical protein
MESRGISIIDWRIAESSVISLSEDFALLIEVPLNFPERRHRLARLTLNHHCKFVAICGEGGEGFREVVLDYLVAATDISVPFMNFDTLIEAVEFFVLGELPITGKFDRIFISLKSSADASHSGISVLSAFNGQFRHL